MHLQTVWSRRKRATHGVWKFWGNPGNPQNSLVNYITFSRFLLKLANKNAEKKEVYQKNRQTHMFVGSTHKNSSSKVSCFVRGFFSFQSEFAHPYGLDMASKTGKIHWKKSWQSQTGILWFYEKNLGANKSHGRKYKGKPWSHGYFYGIQKWIHMDCHHIWIKTGPHSPGVHQPNLVGGWATYPSEKWWTSSVWMMTFPIWWEIWWESHNPCSAPVKISQPQTSHNKVPQIHWHCRQ